MEERSKLPPDNKKYRPLYRDRMYKMNERLITKRVQMSTWFTGEDVGDPWRQCWKNRIRRKGEKRLSKECVSPVNMVHSNPSTSKVEGRYGLVGVLGEDKIKETTTTFFVPASKNSQLYKLILQKEETLLGQMSWGVKVLEKAGTPIASMLLKKFPMEKGCPLGEHCRACEGDGIKCSVKGVVYQATCLDCSNGDVDEIPKYIGETSRLFRTRTSEHMSALSRLSRKSFQLQHWMESHGMSSHPPQFKFKVLDSFKDPLSRQLREALEIMNAGNLNQKTEFKINDLCRLVSEKTEKEKEKEVHSARLERNTLDQHLECFINVMRDVIYKEKERREKETNSHNTFRLKNAGRKRREEEGAVGLREEGISSKKRRMESSTPRFMNYRPQEEVSPEQISPIPRETSPLLVDPDIFEYDLSGADDEPSKMRKKTEVSNDVDRMGVTPRKADSSSTEKKKLFNTTKLIEGILRERGLTKRTVSENDITNESQENVFYGKMKKKRAPRSRSLSLTSLVGELTINKWNSSSSFEEGDIGSEPERIVLTGDACVNSTQTPANGGAGVNRSQTPNGRKRQLSPNELTPLGRMRKMSTEICNSPVLRMKYEFWARLDEDNAVGVTGIVPVNVDVHRDPSTVTVEGRYGLVGVQCEIDNGGNPIAPEMDSGARYGLVEGNGSRQIKTPRRRLGSESVFDRMMTNALKTPRNRSRSVTVRPRGGVKTPMTPSNQKLISSFITPSRDGQ